MYTAKEYVFPESLEQAYDLLCKGKRNRIIGGGGWLALGKGRYHTLIDLSRLGLDGIAEEGGRLAIGAMATLRQLETSPLAAKALEGELCRCVKPIVGVQFRNSATVGGSVYGRFGFSDVLTCLMAADATVTMYRGGEIPVDEFAKRPYEKDILLSVKVPLDSRACAMETMRLTEMDLPILAVCVSRLGEDWRVAIGARPGRAALAKEAMACLRRGGSGEDAGKAAARELAFGSNLRGTAEYRKMLAYELVKRAVNRLR